jgi:hypothetical protein
MRKGVLSFERVVLQGPLLLILDHVQSRLKIHGPGSDERAREGGD